VSGQIVEKKYRAKKPDYAKKPILRQKNPPNLRQKTELTPKKPNLRQKPSFVLNCIFLIMSFQLPNLVINLVNKCFQKNNRAK